MTVKIKQRGFTLVEMSIVLVIIGLILGAVSIGKDMQRDAEYSKIKQKFIDQWAQSYNTHYERAGVVIGDSQTAPRIMVNGALYTAAVGLPVSGGNMSAIAHTGICNGLAAPGMVPAAANLTLHETMDALGIRMPPGRAEGQEDRYVYLDSNGNPQEIQVCFQWNSPTNAAGSGNVMVISGLTPDLARVLDQMIDGKPDAREGLFRQQGVGNGGAGGVAGVIWNRDNRDANNNANANQRNRDEDQVQVVVAHYKMNQ